jgi:aminopeptidase
MEPSGVAVATPSLAVVDAEGLRRVADTYMVDALAVGAGDEVQIECEVEHRELALACVEAAYRAGAKVASILYVEPLADRLRILAAPEDGLGFASPARLAAFRRTLAPGTAVLFLDGEAHPGLLSGADPRRISADARRSAPAYAFWRKATMADRVRWCIAAAPTISWASRVFPELAPDAAYLRLFREIRYTTRSSDVDPPGSWLRHAEALEVRRATMAARSFSSLRFRGPGTELEVGLFPGSPWEAVGSVMGGAFTTCNIPSEEIFVSPDPRRTSGTFACTMPLSLGGLVMTGIRGRFERGRCVSISSDDPTATLILEEALGQDDGASRLGEVALVDRSSRIRQTRRTYDNTLFDENQASHIAFGCGIPSSTRGAHRLTRKGKRKRATVNDSAWHTDVMIGGPGVSVHGVESSGLETPVIVDDEWVLG